MSDNQTTITNDTVLAFVTDIISFLNAKFSADSKIPSTKKPTGNLAFNTSLVKNATKPFYVVQCISNAPRDETFNEIKTLDIYLQIDIYALKGSYNSVSYLAEPMSIILQNVVSNYMSDLKFGNINKNICLMREVASSPAMPFEDGSKAYQSSLRYQFSVMRDYEVATPSNNNNNRGSN